MTDGIAAVSPRRRARFTDEFITMAHGAGGLSSEALLDAVFRPVFSDAELLRADDGAVLDTGMGPGDRMAITTDSFVVTPRRFPGGSIGTLAVCGTVNDLAVMGAVPRWLAVAFVLEEGLAIDELRSIVADIEATARSVGIRIVTGDTKVVERGAADGCYVTTTGVGVVASGVVLGADRVRAGDAVIVSGNLGDHGMAVLFARGELGLEADIASDCAPLHDLVAQVLRAAPNTRWMRDPTRGGLASALNELVQSNGLSVLLHETSLPVAHPVAGACELLGIDPLYVANEGKVVAVVEAEQAEAALAVMRAHPFGVNAAVVGEITADPPGIVMLRTVFGGTRIVDRLVGDPLPRIC